MLTFISNVLSTKQVDSGGILQVHYSLIYRLPEENNVKKTCDELGITLIAYSPLGQGVIHLPVYPCLTYYVVARFLQELLLFLLMAGVLKFFEFSIDGWRIYLYGRSSPTNVSVEDRGIIITGIYMRIQVFGWVCRYFEREVLRC